MSHPSFADTRLPGEAAGVTRWTAGRKEELLRRIRRRQITVEAACERFGFTADEIEAMEARHSRHGARGLLTTKLQTVR